jgi:hypothetical protein
MSARSELEALLTGAVAHPVIRGRAIDAFRAEVLREAADELNGICEEHGVLGVGSRLHRMADAAEAGEGRG